MVGSALGFWEHIFPLEEHSIAGFQHLDGADGAEKGDRPLGLGYIS